MRRSSSTSFSYFRQLSHRLTYKNAGCKLAAREIPSARADARFQKIQWTISRTNETKGVSLRPQDVKMSSANEDRFCMAREVVNGRYSWDILGAKSLRISARRRWFKGPQVILRGSIRLRIGEVGSWPMRQAENRQNRKSTSSCVPTHRDQATACLRMLRWGWN